MERTLGISRRFTSPDRSVYDMVEWEEREARITDASTGVDVFYQPEVSFPVGWEQNSVNIVAHKYFRGSIGSSERESSLADLVGRVVNRIVEWGDADGYFADEVERETFRDELAFVLLTQRAAFNSPVWFNIGVEDTPQQASACFILSVDDSMDSIKDWWNEEIEVFRGGSGAGVNLSNLRASCESIGGSANTSSGPLSFMQAADAAANAIKSGGKTRRAAKMVILDVDHPDVVDFINCKREAEDMARVLRDSGVFDMGFDGKHASWLPYQNANNSVRVTDEFMRACQDDDSWHLKSRIDGRTVVEMPARELMRMVVEAAWACADPGIQFDTTINDWHTTPSAGRINGSNPCSEYMHLDNSSCNLASLNLLKFLGEDGRFDYESFRYVVEIIFIAQDILVGNADYPTESITRTSRDFRQLGIGYANLGALLMSCGYGYDSDEGRSMASAITAIMTAQSYLTSAKMANRLGSFAGFEADKDRMMLILRRHQAGTDQLDRDNPELRYLSEVASVVWGQAVEQAQECGVRNSQASVLAPTGTISFLMGCDTTGIEPMFALVTHKQLAGGGEITILNQSVARALRALGYSDSASQAILEYIQSRGKAEGAPGLKREHLSVFASATGDDAIHYLGHVRMMEAVQPFISGAISKTVNMPNEATVEDIESVLFEAWQRGLKAIAVYRDGCKVAQPISSNAVAPTAEFDASRRELPRHRRTDGFEFVVGGVKGFAHVGLYEDGSPGEIFLTITKQGSTLSGIMDSFAIAVSMGLQHGVPLRRYVKKFVGTNFAPQGMTDDPDLRMASSLLDYIFRRLALDYLTTEDRQALNIASTRERIEEVSASYDDVGIDTGEKSAVADPNAPFCSICGHQMQRAGSCFICPNDGSTSGCS